MIVSYVTYSTGRDSPQYTATIGTHTHTRHQKNVVLNIMAHYNPILYQENWFSTTHIGREDYGMW